MFVILQSKPMKRIYVPKGEAESPPSSLCSDPAEQLRIFPSNSLCSSSQLDYNIGDLQISAYSVVTLAGDNSVSETCEMYKRCSGRKHKPRRGARATASTQKHQHGESQERLMRLGCSNLPLKLHPAVLQSLNRSSTGRSRHQPANSTHTT